MLEPCSLRLEVGHDAGVHQLPPVALHGPATFGDHVGKTTGPLPQLLDPDQRVARSLSPRADSSASAAITAVSRRASSDRSSLRSWRCDAVAGEGVQPCPEPGDLTTGEERRSAVSSATRSPCRGGLGLALERTELAAHLSQQVLHPQQVALGRFEAALGLLLALAVLEDAGGLLDDRPALLRAGVEHRVDLALADDHVLLAADAGIGQELLQVEQPARRRR